MRNDSNSVFRQGGLYRLTAIAAALVLASCAANRPAAESGPPPMESRALEQPVFQHERVSTHREGDDLLTAGLGLSGLQAAQPPAFANPEAPTAFEVRRRAVWSSWRGIADLSPAGGFGRIYGSTASVPGREYAAYATVPGAAHPHRVLVQVPDDFDSRRRCLVVAPSSGSRGVYGAIAVAGPWALPRGCAVAYTDKGAGSDYFDLDADIGFRIDGTAAGMAEADDLAFVPEHREGSTGVAFKHAHSGDNPEAHWGAHVYQAAVYGLEVLSRAFPGQAPFDWTDTRVIAVGISNGGGAVLQAAALEGGWLDAVVAGEPNVLVDGTGSRALYDYTTEAALLMPCALLDLEGLPQPPLADQVRPFWEQRCASLAGAGLVEGGDTQAQARAAHAALTASGWSDEALRAGVLSAGFDLWRAVATTYASAYGRHGVGEHPCGMSWAVADAGGPRPATAVERAAWWPDGSGIPPGNGITLLDPSLAAADPGFAGLQCLRALWSGDPERSPVLHAGVAATTAGLPRAGLPVMVVHGIDDGLIPMDFSSRPYVDAVRATGGDIAYWQVANVQHFDAFLGLPDYGARYLPLLPYVYEALERVDRHLDGEAPLPSDAVVRTVPRAGDPLEARHLAMPR